MRMRLCQMTCALHAVGSFGRDSRPESKACVLSGCSLDGGKRIESMVRIIRDFHRAVPYRVCEGLTEDRRHGVPNDPRPVFNRNVESLQVISMPLNSRRNSVLSRWKALMHIRNISSIRGHSEYLVHHQVLGKPGDRRVLPAGNRLGEDPVFD